MKRYKRIKTYNLEEMSKFFAEILWDTQQLFSENKYFPSKEILIQQIEEALNKECPNKNSDI